MPARGKSRPLRRRPKTQRFRLATKSYPRVWGYPKRIQVWGKSSYTNSSTEKRLVGVDGCKSGKKTVEVGSISHWFRGFCTSQVVSRSSSINSTRLKADIQNPQHPNQQTPSNPTTKTLKRSVWSVGLRVTKSKKILSQKNRHQKIANFQVRYTLEDFPGWNLQISNHPWKERNMTWTKPPFLRGSILNFRGATISIICQPSKATSNPNWASPTTLSQVIGNVHIRCLIHWSGTNGGEPLSGSG